MLETLGQQSEAMSVRVWRGVAAGLSVIVAAVTGVVTNLVTDRWSLALAASLGLLVMLGVTLQVGSTMLEGRVKGGPGPNGRAVLRVRQRATARGTATIIQAGRDAHVPVDSRPSPELRRNPPA